MVDADGQLEFKCLYNIHPNGGRDKIKQGALGLVRLEKSHCGLTEETFDNGQQGTRPLNEFPIKTHHMHQE